jgi:hypothetical protein
MNDDFKKFTVLYNIRMTDRHTVVMHDYAREQAKQAKLDELNETLLELSDCAEAREVIDYIKNL